MFEKAKRELRAVRADIQRECRTAVGTAIKKGWQEARYFSHGPLSMAQLSALKHPYSARRPNFGAMPGGDPTIINYQTGAFARDWMYDPPRATDSGISAKIYNDNEVADYLNEGTDRMVRRPLADFISDRLTYYALYELELAKRRLYVKYGR